MHLKMAGLLALAASLPACGLLEQDNQSAAESALAENDYRAARVHLAKLLAETPDSADLRLRYAEVLLALGDGIGAEAALDQLSGEDATSPDAAALHAHAALLQDKPEEALDWAAKAGTSHPLAVWARIGATLAKDDFEQAVEMADAAVAAHPKDARILALRGEIALQQRSVESARRLADRALEAEPGSLPALMLAGKIAVLREDLAQAEKHYSAASKTHKGVLGPLIALGAVQADRGQVEQAADTIAQVRGVAPAHPLGVFLDAKLAFVTGDLDKANALMQENERSLRKIPAAQLLLGEIAHLRGNQEQAIAILRQFLQSNPDHIHGAMVMAQARLALGEKRAAFETVSDPAKRAVAGPQILALASRLAQELGEPDPYAARLAKVALPSDYATRLSQADKAIAAGKWDEADSIYQGLLGQGMDAHAPVLNNGALAALEAGRKGDALQLARRAHALTPDHPQVTDTLGWVIVRSGGSAAEAQRLLRSAVAQVPGNLEFRWHLAAALAAGGQKAEARKLAQGVREFAGPEQREHIDRLLASL